MISGDVTITTTRTVSEVIYEIDGNLVILAENLDTHLKQSEQQIATLHNEIRLVNERINSVNDHLTSVQYTLNLGVSVVSILLVAIPLVWSVRKWFSFSIKGAIREAVKAELDARGE